MHFLHGVLLIPFLFLVLLLAGGYVALQRFRKRYVARFSNVELLGTVAPRRPGWRRHLTFALFLIAASVLSVGAAKPAGTVRVPRDNATVMLAIDVSLSMKATDVLPTRLKAAQTAGKTFVGLLPPRINLGLVDFARLGSVLVSPTLNRDQVKRSIDQLQLASYTAIGEGIFASLNAIKTFTAATTPKGSKAPPGRIVLLSDGENTTGRSVASAVNAARAAHIEVSTIAFGTQDGTVTQDGLTVRVPANIGQLRGIAQATGGSFHTAASEQELRSVYKNIGSQIGYTDEYRDISYYFLVIGLFVLLVAGGTAMLWGGRLV
jgi:Ca-activated chloride channel family protein